MRGMHNSKKDLMAYAVLVVATFAVILVAALTRRG